MSKNEIESIFDADKRDTIESIKKTAKETSIDDAINHEVKKTIEPHKQIQEWIYKIINK